MRQNRDEVVYQLGKLQDDHEYAPQNDKKYTSSLVIRWTKTDIA